MEKIINLERFVVEVIGDGKYENNGYYTVNMDELDGNRPTGKCNYVYVRWVDCKYNDLDGFIRDSIEFLFSLEKGCHIEVKHTWDIQK